MTTGKSSEKKVSLPKGTTTAGKSASASRERSVFEDDDEDEAPAVDEDIPPAAVEPDVVDARPAFPVPEPRAKEQSSSRGSSQQWVEVPPSSAGASNHTEPSVPLLISLQSSSRPKWRYNPHQ